MATAVDDTGIKFLTPDQSIITSKDSTAVVAEMQAKAIKAQDLDDVANYYRTWFGVNWAPRPVGALITADDHNTLRSAIVNAMGGAWVATIPDAVTPGGLIRSSFWGKPKCTFTGATYEFTTPGTYTVFAPPGARTLHVVQMIAGGGGGGIGMERAHGHSAGGGGSGGYRSNEYYTIADNQTLTVVVGEGGVGCHSPNYQYPDSNWYTGYWTDANGNYVPDRTARWNNYVGYTFVQRYVVQKAGGDSYIVAGGQNLAYCTGGGPGLDNNGDYGGTGGYGGTPNGKSGNWGNRGRHDDSDGDGAWGAASQLGSAQRPGSGGNPWPSNSTGYGAGGSSAGWRDRHRPWTWPGANGSGGYCKFELLPPSVQ